MDTHGSSFTCIPYITFARSNEELQRLLEAETWEGWDLSSMVARPVPASALRPTPYKELKIQSGLSRVSTAGTQDILCISALGHWG